MIVRVNGTAIELADDATVGRLVAERFGDQRWLAVALNGEVVPRSQWAECRLGPGANVEVLTAVQGG